MTGSAKQSSFAATRKLDCFVGRVSFSPNRSG
jgi:hypothetical protein